MHGLLQFNKESQIKGIIRNVEQDADFMNECNFLDYSVLLAVEINN